MVGNEIFFLIVQVCSQLLIHPLNTEFNSAHQSWTEVEDGGLSDQPPGNSPSPHDWTVAE